MYGDETLMESWKMDLTTWVQILDDWFSLVWFYDISTIVGYLMPNPLYAYILDIDDL